MATIGEVILPLRADTAQFQQGLRRAQADLKQASADFRTGRLSARDFATAVDFAEQEVRQFGAAAQQQLRPGLVTARTQLKQARVGALNAAKGMGTVRSSLASLAAMTIGVKGTLGTFTSALLFMSVGNLTAIGVIAGIAGIVRLFQLLGDRAKKARERTDELREANQRLVAQSQIARRNQLLGQRVQARRDLASAQAEFDAASRGETVSGGPRFVTDESLFALARAVQVARAQVRAVNQELREFQQSAKDATEKGIAPFLDEIARGRAKMEAFAAMWNDLNRAADQMARRNQSPFERYNEGLREANTLLRLQLIDLTTFNRERQRLVDELFRGGKLGKPSDTDKRLLLRMRDGMTDLGAQAGEALVRGMLRSITDARTSLLDVFKRTLAALIEAAAIEGLRRAFRRSGQGSGFDIIGTIFSAGVGFAAGGPGGAAAAGITKAAGGASKSVAAPVINVTVPPPTTPFDTARDQQWQEAFRESARVAQRDGFRFG